MSAILVFFHCPSNSGYAIARLERVFFECARRLVGSDDLIHFAYSEVSDTPPLTLPAGFRNVISMDPTARSRESLAAIEAYVRRNNITFALGFDQPPHRAIYRALRAGGVRSIASYWGAPMSSLNRGIRLLLKRLDVLCSRIGPDHYIFESEGMRRTAVQGRGIPANRTSVTYLGVDTDEFAPAAALTGYAHDVFAIPRDRRIVYFSGHFEERKGVGVIMRAARHLVNEQKMRGVHFLLLGNQAGGELPYRDMIVGTEAADHVTFAGYRSDGAQLLRDVSIGVIASTGWDSFTMSSLEISAAGVPLIVSKLLGLEEAVEDGRTGLTFPVDDSVALAGCITTLLDNESRRLEMGVAARQRILAQFTVDHQLDALFLVLDRVRRGG